MLADIDNLDSRTYKDRDTRNHNNHLCSRDYRQIQDKCRRSIDQRRGAQWLCALMMRWIAGLLMIHSLIRQGFS